MVPSQWLAATQNKLKEALAVVAPSPIGTGSPPAKKGRTEENLIASPRGRTMTAGANSEGSDGAGMSSIQTALYKSMKVFAEAADEKFTAIEPRQQTTDDTVEDLRKELAELKEAREVHLVDWRQELDQIKADGEARHKETVA